MIRRNVLGHCVLLTSVLLFTACPKDGAPDKARIGVSSRSPSESPAKVVVPEAVAFNGERAMDHVRKQLRSDQEFPVQQSSQKPVVTSWMS